MSAPIRTPTVDSCYYIFVAEANKTPLEKKFISKLNLLSNAVGKQYVLIITEDKMRDKFDSKTSDKKAKKKGGSKGTISGSVKLPEQGYHEIVFNVVQERVIEYLYLLNESSEINISTTDPPLSKMNQNSSKKKKSLDQVEKTIELDNILDDRPPFSPELFVVLVGFTDPELVLEFQSRNIPLKCIIKVQEETGISSNTTSKTNNNSAQLFWVSIDQQSRLQSANFFVTPLLISNMLLDNINYIYDILCCVLYDIVETVQGFAKYIQNCRVYSLDDVKVENTVVYDKLMSYIPLECVNVEYVLHCIIEQVVKIDDDYNCIKETEEDGDISEFSLPFIGNVSYDNYTEKEMQELSTLTDSSSSNVEQQLPFILRKTNENSRRMSRTFYYRDRYARNCFHLNNFPELFLTLSNTIKLSVHHLKKMPADLTYRERSFLTFHVNRLLKHVKSNSSSITYRQIKHYLELSFFLIIFTNKNLKQLRKISNVSYGDDATEAYGTECLQEVHKKYEQLSDIEESSIDDEVKSSESFFNIDTDMSIETDCAQKELWDLYNAGKTQQVEELRSVIILSEFKSLFESFETNQFPKSSSLVNIQVEHLSSHVLDQVLHENRLLHKKCDLRYFSPSDSLLIIFYNPTSYSEYWSSAGKIPRFMNMQTFFNLKNFKQNRRTGEEVPTLNSGTKIRIDNKNNTRNYAYDIDNSHDNLTEAEFFLNENGLIVRINKITFNKCHFMSVVLQVNTVFVSLCAHNNPMKSNKENHPSNTSDNIFATSSMNTVYMFENLLKLVLNDSTVVSVSKNDCKNTGSEVVNNSLHSDFFEFESLNLEHTIHFSITLPNGLLIESHQLGNETVIKQNFIFGPMKNSVRYYFKNGKVLFSHGNDNYHVYHGNGDKTYCEGVRNDVHSIYAEEKFTPLTEKQTVSAEKIDREFDEQIQKHSQKLLKKYHMEYLDAMGNFKRFKKSDLNERYSQKHYKYACNLLSGELYMSREDGLKLYILDTSERNTMMTQFNNTLTFISEYNVRDEEEYVSDTDEGDTLSELNLNIGENDDIQHVENEENFNQSLSSKYSKARTFDGFVIIDQAWKIEEQYFAPIIFTSDGKIEINLSDLKICYQNDQVHLITENVEVNAQVDSIQLRSLGTNELENQVIFDWSGIKDDIMQATSSGNFRFNLNSNGIPTVDKFDVSVSDSIMPLSIYKCFVINRDGSGYEFVDGPEVINREKTHTTFQTVRYTLPQCKELFQTNIQRKVEAICDKFLFNPTSIKPLLIKRGDLKSSHENTTGWLFYTDYNTMCSRSKAPVHFNRTTSIENVAIEVQKFEQIMPTDVDILKILRSAFEEYLNEGSSVCDQFNFGNGNQSNRFEA